MKEHRYVSRKSLCWLGIFILIGTILAGQNSVVQTNAQTPSPKTPPADTWNLSGTMATDRAFQTATLLMTGPKAGNVVVIGGENWNSSTQHYLNSTEFYDANANTWTSMNAMPTPRAWHTATALTTGSNASNVLVVGGVNNSGLNGSMASLNTVELYDPVGNRWT